MTRDGSVELFWADGPHRFRLAIGHLRELQEKTDVGPYRLLERLRTGDWRVDDVRETLRLGLIGGGMTSLDAYRAVVRYVDDYGQPLLDHVPVAAGVLMGALLGPQDEPVGKTKPAAAKKRGRKGASPSPASMETAGR